MNENGASRPQSQWVWLSLSPQSCPNNCSMEDISGVILNWFNPQQQQYRYSITIKLKHMRPSCYSRCKQKKKNRKQWIWFHPWTRYICCFLFYVLKQNKKKLPQSVLCGYFVHHFFLKVASISFFKNESPLCTSKRHTLDSQPTKSTVQIIHGQFHQTIYWQYPVKELTSSQALTNGHWMI